MSQEIKIRMIFIAVVLSCTLVDGKLPRYRRATGNLKETYIVHYSSKGQPLGVVRFGEFVRALNQQQANSGMKSSSYVKSPEFPSRQSTPTTVSELMTTTEPTTAHQLRPLAAGTLRTLGTTATATSSSPVPTYVSISSTTSPLKLHHEISSTSTMADPSVSTDKPTLTFALGNEETTMSPPREGFSSSDISDLVTTLSQENSPSKITFSGLGFPQETGSTSGVISLQPPGGVQTLLNYAHPSVTTIHGYVPAPQTSYIHALPSSTLQKPYPYSTQNDISNYASYPSQNIAITDGKAPLQIVHQAPSALIDIGQGLGQGYRSAPQEIRLNLGGWGGVDYSAHRSIPLVKPVLDIASSGYTLPVSSPALSKIGFGPGTW